MKKPSTLLLVVVILFFEFVSAQPANDACSSAILLTSGFNCSTVTGTLKNNVTNVGATATAGINAFCGNAASPDVWYTFVAQSAYPVISLKNMGSNMKASPRLQLFNTTSCTVATLNANSLGCVSGTNTTSLDLFTSVNPGGSGLTIGTTYLIRIFTNGNNVTATPSSTWNFDICITDPAPSRMNEVFKQTTLTTLNTAWEVTYGPDGYLWATESHGYKAYRIDPNTGTKTTILDITHNSVTPELTAAEHTAFNVVFDETTQNPWPQGGFAGLAIHPQFNSGKPYVYISYVRSYTGGSSGPGYFFTNSLVRFTYNSVSGKLESPVALCDTLPGSSDHNSQRVIIAPVGGTNYLFYAQGDMGAGQLSNSSRTNKAQNLASYEGKILRFNLEADGDAGAYDKWIPNDNPFNGASQSAIWCIGIRNNQGWAYDTTLGILYGACHGPYSDDEINIIEESKNYGHPLVIGYAADTNYNGSNAGTPNNTPASSLSIITDEVAAAAAIPNYKDPLFCGYAPSKATLHNIWLTNPSNGTWPSEAWSGMDIYKHTLIPGWKNSLVLCGLKWGRVLRLKLGPTGTTIVQTNGADTVAYFGGKNRYRDLAFAPNGKDIFVSMEGSTSSGPNANNPLVPTCANCIVKYTFLGYEDAGGKSTIPDAIDVTDAPVNTIDSATTVTIDNTNNYLWVPITGPDGNIMAEIKANGNNLGVVRSAFYKNSGPIRISKGVHYLDRNITITPQTQPSSAVSIRLYMSKAEYDALDLDPLSGVNAITDLKILKNQDPCSSAIASGTTIITPAYAEAHGTNGYMLQGSISSFSSFYFASSNITLPLNLLSFKGSLQNSATILEWETTSEINTSLFNVERSNDGRNFQPIGTVAANGNSGKNKYSYTDNDAMHLGTLTLYYRLKMVDKDGSYTYSDVVIITLPAVAARVSLFPNPAVNAMQLTVTVAADARVKWNVIDNTGRTLIHNVAQVRKGENTLSVNVSRLSTGSYYLSVSGGGIDEKIKFEKL